MILLSMIILWMALCGRRSCLATLSMETRESWKGIGRRLKEAAHETAVFSLEAVYDTACVI